MKCDTTYARERQWLLREKYAGRETPAYADDCVRLAAGEPLAYLIGYVPFLDVTIHLASRPLIPRPETEYWTQRAIDEIRAAYAKPHILDLCAGSGCIGVAVLHALGGTAVFAEIDERHHRTIADNVLRNAINPDSTRIYGGDLFASIPPQQFDAILTNPPYIDPARRARIEPSVLHHEPHRALFGGVRGLAYIERIMRDALPYLARGGRLYIEHEPEQAPSIATQGERLGYAACEACVDQYGDARYTRLQAA